MRARIAAARARIARQTADRANRRRRRAHGLAQRHAAKLARQHAADPDPQETDRG